MAISGTRLTALDGGTFVRNLNKQYLRNAKKGSVAKVYPSAGYYEKDTGARTTNNGPTTYRTNAITSVKDSILDFELGYNEKTNEYEVGAISPDNFQGQVFGRWEMRVRADVIEGYKIAFLLFPDADQQHKGGDWKRGEVDFPEGDLENGIIHGFSHDVTGSPEKNAFGITTTARLAEWHTFVIEITPTTLSFGLDGNMYTTRDPRAIPRFPMHLVLQCEGTLNKVLPPKTARGHVQVDWVGRWTYVPPKAGEAK